MWVIYVGKLIGKMQVFRWIKSDGSFAIVSINIMKSLILTIGNQN